MWSLTAISLEYTKNYAPVKLFCPHPPPGQPRGQRKYECDKKGRGTQKKGDFGDYIGRASKN